MMSMLARYAPCFPSIHTSQNRAWVVVTEKFSSVINPSFWDPLLSR